MKKPLKETRFYKIAKPLLQGAWDVLPLPNLRTFFDTDKDGKITTRDLKGIAWLKIAGAVAILALLMKYNIVNPQQVMELLKLLLAG